MIKKLGLPDVKGVSEMAARMLQPLNITVAHKPTATLQRELTRIKDKVTPGVSSNVIYKIDCKDWECFYVGQTGRMLKTRIHEHRLAVNRHDHKSLVSAHIDDKQHEFNWNEINILGRANTRHGREFIEAWFTRTGSINKHVEMETVYEPLRVKSTITNDTSQQQNTGATITSTLDNEQT